MTRRLEQLLRSAFGAHELVRAHQQQRQKRALALASEVQLLAAPECRAAVQGL